MDWNAVGAAISKGGALPVLIAVIIVIGREYRRVERQRDRWQNLAMRAMSDADHGAGLAEFFREASDK